MICLFGRPNSVVLFCPLGRSAICEEIRRHHLLDIAQALDAIV
jgi:hypothetical protein